MIEPRRQLARRLSPLSVWALSLGCIIGWGSFIMPGTTFLPQAGPVGCALAVALAAVVMVVIAFNYSYMIVRYPKAGGEYAYVSASFGSRHAFACSWLLGLCYLSLVAQNATALALVGRSALGNMLQVGFHYTVAGYDVYGAELLLALGALAVFAFLSIRGVHLTGVLQTLLVLFLVGGVLVVVAAAIASPHVGLSSMLPAFSPTNAPIAGFSAVLAVSPFLFVGFDTIPQAAEEYHFPPARTKALTVASIAFGAFVYIALNTLAACVVPTGFSAWPDYIAAAGTLAGPQSIPTFNAAITLLGPVGLAVVCLAALGAILSGIVGFYLATSRLLFAMGRDGMLPEWFSQVHPRFRTPRNAILFVFAVSVIAPFFGRTVLGWLVDMSALGAAVAYGYTSFAAFRRAREEKNRSMAVTGAVGLAFSVVFAALLLVPLPGLSSSMSRESYVCLAVWVAVGLVFYCVRVARKGR